MLNMIFFGLINFIMLIVINEIYEL